jgi:hypothetical protein
MAGFSATNKIKLLQQRWVNYQLAADGLFSAAITLTIGWLFYYASIPLWWCLPVFAIIFWLFCMFRQPWAVTAYAISGYLNVAFPELEESCELAIKPGNLNLLESLQLMKVEAALQNIPSSPAGFAKRLKTALIILAAALVLNFIVFKVHHNWDGIKQSWFSHTENKSPVAVPEKVLPQIDNVSITITPPGYTGKSKRIQDKFTIDAEEEASAKWIITTNIAVKKVSFIFNEKERLVMAPGDGNKSWSAIKVLDKPGFYQVDIDGKLSDLYQIQIIKDMPPVILIKSPKQYTYIDAGEAKAVNINTAITDDYGVSDALIMATVAKGSGEGVKFKEYKINFNSGFADNRRAYDLQKKIDLTSLGMEPGDELYFYIQASDNHKQQSKTDIYIVSIQDTSQLLSMDGILTRSNIKPEFFRSERQIILDTESLLKGKDSTSKDKFSGRANDLGIDQKLLRLRYGKFLGEEEESVIGAEANNELGKAENFSDAAKVLDAYTDKHDNAEDASFLEPSEKAALKATLTEMWKAELHLRMYKPEEALPFEYKALRLLKDLQQKSRAYVAKTSYNPPPIKQEKRLTGDLTKIAQPVEKQDIKPATDQYEALKKAVGVLEQAKTSGTFDGSDRHILQLAGQTLGSKAATEPGSYLAAMNALHRILTNNKFSAKDINTVEKGIQAALPESRHVPQNTSPSVDMDLSKNYHKNLNR